MVNNYSPVIKKVNLCVILYAAATVLFNVFVILLQYKSGDFADFITPYGGILCLFIPLSAFVFLNSVADKNEKEIRLKLIPASFIPAVIYTVVENAVAALVALLPFEKLFNGCLGNPKGCAGALESIIGAVAGAAVLMAASKKLCSKYLEFFFANSKLIFQKEYRLKNKWWFSVAADIIWGVFSTLFTSVLYFAITSKSTAETIDKLVSAAGTVATLVLAYAFFNVAFRKIDKSMRKLFYPFIILESAIGTVLSGAASPIASLISKPTSSPPEEAMKTVASAFPMMIYLSVMFILSFAIYICVFKKSIGAFEQQTENL